jgi:Na+-driven multidrug efflux pump
LLIFGLLGFPRLEIAGAAMATLISNLLVLIGTLLYLHLKLKVFATPMVSIQSRLASWRRVLAVGLPAMFTHTIVPVSNGVIVIIVAGFGVPAVAGLGVAMRIEPIALIAFYALSAVTSPIMGQNFGAGQFQRLEDARVWIGKFSIVFGLLLAAAFSVLATPLSALFTELPETLLVSTTYLWIMPLSYGGYGMVMCACAGFNGLGHPGPAVILSATRALLLLLPLALLGKWFFELPGLFAGAAVSNVVVGVLGYLWLGHKIRELRPLPGT